MTKKIPIGIRIVQLVDILSGVVIVFFFSILIYSGFQMEMHHPINPKPFLNIMLNDLSDPGRLVNFSFVLLCLFFGMFLLWQAHYLKKLTKIGYLIQLIISSILLFAIANSLGRLVQAAVIILMLTKETRLAFEMGK